MHCKEIVMIKNIAIALLAISTTSLAALAVYQHSQITGRTAPAQTHPAGDPSEAESLAAGNTEEQQETLIRERVLLEEERRGFEERITELESQIAASSDVPDNGEPEKKAEPENESPLASIAKLIKNPAMKNMIREQQKGSMNMTYGSLFKYLDLSEEQLGEFKGLLLEKRMALMDISLNMMDGSLTPEQRTQQTAVLGDLTSEHDNRIEEFLGAGQLLQTFTVRRRTPYRRTGTRAHRRHARGAGELQVHHRF
jgi:hypothetical protein